MRVWSLGQEDPLEKGMATHSSNLAWKIPWTGAQEAQRVEHDRSDLAHHSTPIWFPVLLTSCMSVVYLLPLQSWYGDVIINQSSWFPVDFTVCAIKFYGFWQTHSILYPPLHYHINWFHCQENPLCCSSSSLFPPKSLGGPIFFF